MRSHEKLDSTAEYVYKIPIACAVPPAGLEAALVVHENRLVQDWAYKWHRGNPRKIPPSTFFTEPRPRKEDTDPAWISTDSDEL